MKKIFLNITLLLTCAYANAQTGYLPSGLNIDKHWRNPIGGDWKLVFSDEFNYTGAPDATMWEAVDRSDANWNPKSEMKASNVTVHNGRCYLTIKNEPNGRYSAAEMISRNTITNQLNEWEHGVFQAKIKMPQAFFSHSTFWLWNHGTDLFYTPYGPTDSEVDIAECDGWAPNDVPRYNHNFYKDPADLSDRGSRLYDWTSSAVSFNTQSSFHIYTLVWNKNFMYVYFDNTLMGIEPRLTQGGMKYYSNTPSAGVYDVSKPFFALNEKAYIILSNSLQSKDTVIIKKGVPNASIMPELDPNVNNSMEIDWVRVYQRDECDESDVITNSTLFPFNNLSDKNIVLGTQDQYLTWANITPVTNNTNPRGCGSYEAESILILPNFISYPEYKSMHTGWGNHYEAYTAFSYVARPCQTTYTDFREIELDPTVDPFNNGKMALNDNNGTSDNNQKKYGNATMTTNIRTSNIRTSVSKLTIHPNPTTGQLNITMPAPGDYDVKISSMLGVVVYLGKLKDEQQKQIQLENSLPSGNYTVQITGKDVNHIEKITLTR